MDTKALRQKILDLAIHGKLVPQDSNDEPASVLLERIRAEKERLIKEGKIKKGKKSAKTSDKPHYPYELPKGWEWCKLEEISYDFMYGTSEKSSRSGNVPVLRMGNINRDGGLDWSNLVYSNNKEDIDKFNLLYNDLLFNRTNSSDWVGKTAIYKGEKPAIYAGYIIRLRTILVNADYINFVMNSQYHRNWCNEVKTDAVNQSNINAQKLSTFMVPIPPIEEQKRIVTEIEHWLSLINLIKKGKEKLKSSIKQAKSKVLDLAIHGKLVPQNPNDEPASELLKRINPKAEIISDNGHYQKNVPFVLPKGWCWTTLKSLSNYGECTNVDVQNIPKASWILELEDIEKDSAIIVHKLTKNDREIKGIRHKFQKGDILYSKLRTYLNKVLIAPEDGFCTTEIISFSAFEGIDNHYLCNVLRSQYFLDYTIQCGYGVKMPRLSTKDAQKGFIPLPPVAEQKRIVAKIEKIFHQLDVIEECL